MLSFSSRARCPALMSIVLGTSTRLILAWFFLA
jgi:hypothetical protein